MQVFAIFDVSDPDPVRERIKARYGDNCYETGRNSFFVATEGETTRQLASAIGLGDESASSGIVIPVTSYWGRHDSQLWEWIGVKLNANGG